MRLSPDWVPGFFFASVTELESILEGRSMWPQGLNQRVRGEQVWKEGGGTCRKDSSGPFGGDLGQLLCCWQGDNAPHWSLSRVSWLC